MERKLVTIREVAALEPIAGADRIELAKIDGWQCVVQKGRFEVGQWGVFHEIDSVVPLDKEHYAFLKERHREGRTHHRVRSMKLKGVLSQGVFLRIDEVAGLGDHLLLPVEDDPAADYALGRDVTEFCGVTKYEPPQAGVSQQQGVARVSTFPGFIPRTDLERCQNLKKEIAESIASGERFAVQAKMDGSSLTAYYVPADGPIDSETGVCSRNQEIVETEAHDNPFWQAVRDNKWDVMLPIISGFCGGAVAIQGELCGPKIQGNPLKLEANKLYLFDVYSVVHARYLLPQELAAVLMVLKMRNGIDPETVDTFDIHTQAGDVDFMLEKIDGIHKQLMEASGLPLEGVVFKSETTGFRFKVISNSYLLDIAE